MADVNYSVVDFSGLSAVSDGKTLLYTDGQVCKSEKNLGELIGKETISKLDTTAFSTVSGNFLTAHQAIPESANWNESYETVTSNGGTWNNVSNIKSFTSIAGIEAETSADSIQITNGDNVFITTANKTITISAKDTTYTTEDFIAADHLSNIVSASGYANDWNTNKSNVELASGYAKVWSDNSATIIANGNSGVSALNTITANSSTWTKVTALSEGSNVQISNNNENYTIGVSGVVTSASDSLDNKLLVLYNNQWQEYNETGAFEVVALKDGQPDVQNPDPKVIYLTKEEDSTKTDPYTEWIYSDKWEIIGETSVPLSNYYKKNETSGKDQLSTEFDKKLDSSAAETAYAPISLTATVNTLTGSSASWNEVSAKFDSSAMTAYYTKSETSGSTEISDALAGKEDKIFVAIYNSTTYADLETAFNAGKKIVVQLSQGVDVKYAQLVEYFRNPGQEAFQFSTSYGAGYIKTCSCTKANGWSDIVSKLLQEELTFGYNDDAISSINGSALIPENKTVPTVTPTTDQGKVLTVNDSDQIVWAEPSIQISQYNGDYSVIKAENDTSSGGYVFDVNIDDSLDTVAVSIDGKQVRKLKVTNPVPSTDAANTGDVLTYDGSTIGWAPVQGGGGGNPYTKASVTPGDCYLNGKMSDYNWPLYDQDVSISNNTYSVLPSPIGWYPDWTDEQEKWHPQHNLDNLVIKLPSNTEFPMAVVEFTIQDNDNYSYWGCVNNVKVKVGEIELTRMYSAPYNPNTLLLGGDYHDQFEYWKLVTVPNGGNPYYRIEEIRNEYRGADITAFAHGTKVQVQIFGSCFNVTISQACGEPAAS